MGGVLSRLFDFADSTVRVVGDAGQTVRIGVAQLLTLANDRSEQVLHIANERGGQALDIVAQRSGHLVQIIDKRTGKMCDILQDATDTSLCIMDSLTHNGLRIVDRRAQHLIAVLHQLGVSTVNAVVVVLALLIIASFRHTSIHLDGGSATLLVVAALAFCFINTSHATAAALDAKHPPAAAVTAAAGRSRGRSEFAAKAPRPVMPEESHPGAMDMDIDIAAAEIDLKERGEKSTLDNDMAGELRAKESAHGVVDGAAPRLSVAAAPGGVGSQSARPGTARDDRKSSPAPKATTARGTGAETSRGHVRARSQSGAVRASDRADESGKTTDTGVAGESELEAGDTAEGDERCVSDDRRILVFGAACSGKSSLIRMLTGHGMHARAPSIGRSFATSSSTSPRHSAAAAGAGVEGGARPSTTRPSLTSAMQVVVELTCPTAGRARLSDAANESAQQSVAAFEQFMHTNKRGFSLLIYVHNAQSQFGAYEKHICALVSSHICDDRVPLIVALTKCEGIKRAETERRAQAIAADTTWGTAKPVASVSVSALDPVDPAFKRDHDPDLLQLLRKQRADFVKAVNDSVAKHSLPSPRAVTFGTTGATALGKVGRVLGWCATASA